MKRRTILSNILAVSMLLTGAIELSSASAAPGDRIQISPSTPTPSIGTLKAPVLYNCATGFNKTNHQKDSEGVTTVLECTTPTIKCPESTKYAGFIMDREKAAQGSHGVQFRYRCKYFTPAG
jgi:hypothetical protein